jgi:hypothetical protein
MEGNDTVTTYGPTTFTLAHRLLAADAVAVIKRAKLVEIEIDELSEGGREIGTFELAVATVVDGEDVPDIVRVRVAQSADGAWPIPTEGRFLALLQRDPARGGWELVHESAYPLRGSTFVFHGHVGADPKAKDGTRVTLAALRRLVADRDERLAHEANELADREGRALKEKPPRLPSEMPESDLVVSWLDLERAAAGREGKPDDTPDAVDSAARRST